MIKRIKTKLQKIMLAAVSSMMAFSAMTTGVFAATGVTNSIRYSDWILIDPTDGSEHGIEGYLLVDDTPVYCVDYYTAFRRGVTVTAGTYRDIGISEEKAKRLSLIAYYGNKVLGRTDRDWYAITQGLIWREIHGRNDLEWVRTNTAYTYEAVQQKWNEILADVNRYYISPSFVGAEQTVDADRSITLNDTNGVLKDMVVASSGGLDVSINGNQLTIKGSTSVNEANIVLRKNIPASETGASIYYTSDACQAVATFKISDPMQVSMKVKVNQFGKLELTKYNDDKSGTVPETTYHITGPYGFDGTYTTDEDGKIKLDRLPVGEYTAVETQAGTGYLIDTTEFGFTIRANETTQIDPTNIEPTGKIELTKQIDTSKTDDLVGDASLEGNTYALYAKDKITNKSGTKTYYQKDELVSSKKTDANGQATWDDLPLGNYYIKETESNDSLVLNKNIINISIEYKGQTVKKVIEKTETFNRVNMQKIQVFKSGEKDGISGVVKGLQGATFTFKLKSEVDHVGWDNAAVYAEITTDENGKANTPYLPYGTYLVKETVTPKDYITAPDFTVSVTDDYSEYEDVEQIKVINVNNRPFTSQVKLVKVDEETGQTVTLNSASFKIRDSEGNYVVQKVAGEKIDTFTTNSKNQITAVSGHKGEVTLPLELDAGTYSIEEIQVPDGFLSLKEPVSFTITNQYDYDVDEDDDPVLTVKIKNDKPHGKLVIQKKIEDFEADKSLIGRDDLSGYQFTLFAKEDIISPIDGSILYKAGSEYGKYTTDHSGNIAVNNIPMGKYYLKETSVVEGCLPSDEIIDINFIQEDFVTKEYLLEKEVTNKTTKYEFSKKAVTGENELNGAHLVVTDDTGAVIDEWDSGEQTHIIEGLTVGKTYSLTETISPDGYVKSTSIQFTVKKDGTVNKVTMIDKIVTMLKVDTNGKAVEGAKIQVLNEEGKIIDEWISTDEPHAINNLEEGNSYILREEEAPKGYALASDIEFTVTDEKQNQSLKMTDKQVIVKKLDQLDQYVKGAKLQVFDANKNIIDEWESDEEHIVTGLVVGQSYILHEVEAPNNYLVSEDIEFTVTEDFENQVITMKDIKLDDVFITKYDATTMKELPGAHLEIRDKEGQLVEEWISTEQQHQVKLVVGDTYTLTETIAPDGYKLAQSIEFTVIDNGEVEQQIQMIDELLPVVQTHKVNTGDYTNWMFAVATLVISSCLLLTLFIRKRKEKNED